MAKSKLLLEKSISTPIFTIQLNFLVINFRALSDPITRYNSLYVAFDTKTILRLCVVYMFALKDEPSLVIVLFFLLLSGLFYEFNGIFYRQILKSPVMIFTTFKGNFDLLPVPFRFCQRPTLNILRIKLNAFE